MEVNDMLVVDGFRYFGASIDVIAKHGHIRREADKVGLKVASIDDISTGPAVLARLYRNWWIVDCPDCRNAEFVWLESPVFMCSNCFNGAVGRQWRAIELPANRQQIETVIRARPLPHTRNWTPGETIADLKRENREHNLPEEV